MKLFLIILGCVVLIGVLRVLYYPEKTLKGNLKKIFFVDIISDLFMTLLDKLDIDL
jgi:hypothetical protein